MPSILKHILKLAPFAIVALFIVLAASCGLQSHGCTRWPCWSQRVPAFSPMPAFLHDKQRTSMMSWLFQSQHSQLQAAHAPAFSASINASAMRKTSSPAVQAQPATCDVLALNGGPGSYNRVRLPTRACRLFNVRGY